MWDQRYSDSKFSYGTNPNDFLKAEYLRLPTGGNILCLAEGEGRNAVFLATQGFSVTAVDQSQVGLRTAQEFAKTQGVSIKTVVADLGEYDLGKDCWDGIISIWAHLPPALRKHLHAQVVVSVKKSGVMILEAYTEHQLEMSGMGGPPASQRELLMSLDALKKELSGLDFVIGRELNRSISEGKYHQGESAVVQVVAQKP